MRESRTSSLNPGGRGRSGCGWRRVPTTRMPRAAVYRHRARFRRCPRRTQSYLPIEAVDMRDGRTRPRPDRPPRGGGPWQSAKCRPPRIPPSQVCCPSLVTLSPPPTHELPEIAGSNLQAFAAIQVARARYHRRRAQGRADRPLAPGCPANAEGRPPIGGRPGPAKAHWYAPPQRQERF